MTSAQLAMMLVRRTPWSTPSDLPAPDANILATCINQAMHAWFQKANATHIAIPQHRELRGQVALTGTATNGSTTIAITSPPSWLATDGAGSTIRVSGDSKWNRLASLTELQMPYDGATGAVNFVLNHDCAPLGSDTVSVCSNVVVHQNSQMRYPLVNGQIPACYTSGTSWNGQPRVYALEPISPGTGSTPSFVLRVWPLLTVPCNLTFMLGKFFSITLADLITATALPCPEDVATDIIYPIALDNAASEGLLNDKADLRRIAMNAATAVQAIAARTSNPVTDAQWMGTPRGF